MTGRTRIAVAAGCLVAVLVVGLVALRVTGGPGPGTAAPQPRPTPAAPATATGFLDAYVEDGRVVRHDQGGDTVSEGQAYGLLAALAADDERTFGAVWTWTRANLQRGDGLLAWRWEDGAVVDEEPAADADLDAARALVLAGSRWDEPTWTRAGTALGTAVLDDLTTTTARGRILLPGLWAAGRDPAPYDPSYASPAAYAVLQQASGDPRWGELAAGSREMTTALLEASDLPPDWAQVHRDGRVEAMPGPDGSGASVRYGYEAARLPVRYAESCDPADVALAARLVPALERSGDALPAELDLGGGALAEGDHPLGWVGRAAARSAAGDDAGSREDLARAEQAQAQGPTYYGGAWTALAGTMLATSELGGCAPAGGAP